MGFIRVMRRIPIDAVGMRIPLGEILSMQSQPSKSREPTLASQDTDGKALGYDAFP